MLPTISEQVLGEAILQSVQHASFPQAEDVASASVPSTAIPKLLEMVRKAREQTKNEIRCLARESASDVDGWISQARRLQADIKRSQATAHEIVQQAKSGKTHTAKVQDAASKVSFLYSEMAYTESLAQVVEQIRDISGLVQSAQDAVVQNYIKSALETLGDVDGALERLGPFKSTRVVGVLLSRCNDLKATITDNVRQTWDRLVSVDEAGRQIAIQYKMETGERTISMDSIHDALMKLDLLNGFIYRLYQDLDRIIMAPRLARSHGDPVPALIIEGVRIRLSDNSAGVTVHDTLLAIQEVAEYLNSCLPFYIAAPLSAKVVPAIANRLITNWLLPAVPLSTDKVQDFQESLSLVLGLAEFFDELGWTGQQRLREWVDKSAQIWLSMQRDAALAQVRSLCFKNIHQKSVVERVETQKVPKGDAVLATTATTEEQDEDWGADWGVEPQEEPPTKTTVSALAEEAYIEEEDLSAWGVDEEDVSNDEPTQQSKASATQEKELGEDEADSWGWGEDEQETEAAPEIPATPATPTKADGIGHLSSSSVLKEKQPREKEVTLREAYTVTAIPDAIMEIVMQAVSDVAILNQPELVKSAITPASGGLYHIPTLVMAMYRATAVMHYSKEVAGDMLIYNDCTRLSDRLRAFLSELPEKDKSSTLPQHLKPSLRLKLDGDIKAMEGFAKRAYGRAMESQRTIIRDLLDGAQGFQRCTSMPFAGECDRAISMTVDRIYEVKCQWEGVLSHSVLLQSLGSLVSTALAKFINDIEDMSDIAEEESKKLKQYCESLSELSNLFKTDGPDGKARDMTNMYTPNWFKFQYLSEILDSSLADIKYFWTEGELKLEMDAEEVIDLIKALFAESEHRRKAIGDIRRTEKVIDLEIFWRACPPNFKPLYMHPTTMAQPQNNTAEPSQAKVQIRLATRHEDIELPEDPGVLFVSTNLKRYALSSLVNNLLHTEKPIPFEFLINGQFLRTSIDEFLTLNGISAETVLNVEYTRALIPPLQVASFEHDDWVSSIDVLSQTSLAGLWSGGSLGSGQERILSASYDGLLRIWNMSGEVIATSTAPYNAGRIISLKSTKFMSDKKIVASGLDGVVRVYKYDEDAATITPTVELYNHNSGVENVAVHNQSSRILSASTDTTISFFSSSAKESPAAPSNFLPTSNAASNKRVKLSKADKTVPARGALSTLVGHTQPVSSVIFAPNDHTVAYSASHDHTLRTWDLPTSRSVDVRTTGHALLSLTALSKLNLVATGTAARHITLIDPRASATSVSIMTLRGHTGPVVSLDIDPSSDYGLVSGAHDGTCRIWDVRSVRPGAGAQVGEGQVGESVYVLEREGQKDKGKSRVGGEGVKVFSVRWDKAVGILSAGEDKRVQINRGSNSNAS
ncbi:hypothetical protein GQ43DRAFT_422828 [Delitschia confertaspora ATCC 74209]|uniref:Ribosome biogenesis protein YTM1 n=1 Tax=Delitschia confertaspora ATCC 74209 TaxID=1513339 RepID=A0A9P4JH95_9PLEO|nr:hypothetical protein GQ43DRAFT_422828 [Delitschia confertaspora ATCC 74209]